MTTLREAAQQALEALETPIHEQSFMQKQNAITALRAALAQQDEPVEPVDAHTTTLRNLLECCLSWEPDACVLGNVTARQAITALRAALAQQAEPCPNCASLEAQNTELDRKLAEMERAHGIIESEIKKDSHQTLDDAMQQPRAMAQAYESGYNAGVANEREACAKVCESRFMGDLTREDMEARRCAAAIRARKSI